MLNRFNKVNLSDTDTNIKCNKQAILVICGLYS